MKTLSKKAKQGVTRFYTSPRYRAQSLTVGIGLLLSGAMVNAAVPTAASEAVEGLVVDAGTFVASFWPLAIIVTVGFLWFSLFKKGVGKAT